MDHYVGIDLHSNNSYTAIIDNDNIKNIDIININTNIEIDIESEVVCCGGVGGVGGREGRG